MTVRNIMLWLWVCSCVMVTAGCDTALPGDALLPPGKQALDGGGNPKIIGRFGAMSARKAERKLDKVAAQSSEPANVRALIDQIGDLGDEPVYADNDVRLLIDGPSTYARMLEEIAAAQKNIHLETYIFASDKIGRKFADALIERRRAGVEVRVLFDAVGSLDSRPEFFDAMQVEGIELREFHQLTDPATVVSINTRDHRKILVVDGKVAFTGGINVAGTYSSASGGSPRKPRRNPVADGWRDTHVEIRGPAVAGFQRLFLANWNGQGEPVAEERSFFPRPTGHGDDLVQILHAQGGEGEYSTIYHAYLRAMELATDRIWITQAYFAPDQRFIETLRAAARRGVDVRIVVPGVSDIDMVLYASRARYGALLPEGVKFYETRDTVLHAKTAVIDSVWSTVGSSNLDYRSFVHNDEVNAIVLGQRFAGLMESQFLADTKAAKAVTLEDWQNRPLYERAVEVLSRAFDYWL